MLLERALRSAVLATRARDSGAADRLADRTEGANVARNQLGDRIRVREHAGQRQRAAGGHPGLRTLAPVNDVGFAVAWNENDALAAAIGPPRDRERIGDRAVVGEQHRHRDRAAPLLERPAQPRLAEQRRVRALL